MCDLFLAVGPEAPTLAGEWTTRDLAAHLVVRERRPDAGPGIVSSFLRDYSEKVRIAERDRPWTELVERVRRVRRCGTRCASRRSTSSSTPSSSSSTTRTSAGRRTDGRRATLDPQLEHALASSIKRAGGMLTRKATVGVTMNADGVDPVRLHKGAPAVTISGPIGECVLYLYGRKDVAGVTFDGPDDAVASIAETPFGL